MRRRRTFCGCSLSSPYAIDGRTPVGTIALVYKTYGNGDKIVEITKLNKLFCKNMKARRSELKITQQALADLMGVHRVRVTEIENARNEPTLRQVERVAKALDTSAKKLLTKPKKDNKIGKDDLTTEGKGIQ